MVQEVALRFTIAEVCELLGPSISEKQLRTIITALGWQPEGWRHRDTIGHPWPEYNATRLMALHKALVPFLH